MIRTEKVRVGDPQKRRSSKTASSADLHERSFWMARLDKLKELEARLYASMEDADSRALPALAKQYRDTIREIEEIEGHHDNNDEIGNIIALRDAHGEPGAVRPNRTAIPDD